MCGDCIVIFVPETTTLPKSNGSFDSMRNGLKTEMPTITSIEARIAAGTALRSSAHMLRMPRGDREARFQRRQINGIANRIHPLLRKFRTS